MKHMKGQLLIGLAVLFVTVGLSRADTTVTTTSSNGTIVEYVPGKTLIITEDSGPVTYRAVDEVVFFNRRGKEIPAKRAQARMRAGMPVTVQYIQKGEDRIVSRIEIDEEED